MVVGSLVFTSCSGPEFTYVKSSEARAFFKLPSSWTLYNQDRLEAVQGGQAPRQDGAVVWQVAFDAAPRPSLDHVLENLAEHPTGFAAIRSLTPRERDTVSLASLRNLVIQVDRLAQQRGEDAVEFKLNKILVEPGVHGTRDVFTVRLAEGYVTFDQTALLDPSRRLLYLFVVACEANCYERNQRVIELVVSSWTVEER